MADRTQPVVLGQTYRDSITGFEGVATARTEYLFGCVRVTLEGPDKDGSPGEYFVDEQRLTDKPAATSGGSRPAPPRTGLSR